MSTRDALASLVWAEVAASGRRQCEVAADAGITEKHMSQIVHGKTGSLEVIDAVLAAVGRVLVLGTAVLVESDGGAG